jgi:predicted PurR-regulated permease PerM
MRFVMTAVLSVIASPVVLFVNAVIAMVLVILVAMLSGTAGMVCLMLIYATMSCQYPSTSLFQSVPEYQLILNNSHIRPGYQWPWPSHAPRGFPAGYGVAGGAVFP